jgi:hypothetical protein
MRIALSISYPLRFTLRRTVGLSIRLDHFEARVSILLGSRLFDHPPRIAPILSSTILGRKLLCELTSPSRVSTSLHRPAPPSAWSCKATGQPQAVVKIASEIDNNDVPSVVCEIHTKCWRHPFPDENFCHSDEPRCHFLLIYPATVCLTFGGADTHMPFVPTSTDHELQLTVATSSCRELKHFLLRRLRRSP